MARRAGSDDVQRVEITTSRAARRMAFLILFGPFVFAIVLLTLSGLFQAAFDGSASPSEDTTFVPEVSR